ncbi:MAG TPA: AAA family ATPase, partial [Acidimicrobiales bacterium]|nr:AAA family ATPase [Acidimicrobiales bacterium]
ANLTQGPDGRWSAPDGRPIYAWATALGAIYRAQLRAELAGMGLEWDPRPNGLAEVSAIPRDVLRGFSRRRAEIEADQAAAGRSSSRSAEVAQRRTRAPKDPALAAADDQTLRARWERRLGELRVQGRPARPTDVTSAIDWARPRSPSGESRLAALADELVSAPPAEPDAPTRSLTAHASTFSRRDVVRALAIGCTYGAEAETVMAVAADLVASDAVVPLLPAAKDAFGASLVVRDVIRTRDGRVLPAVPTDRRYSTPELLGIESWICAQGLRLREGDFARVPHRHLAGMLAASPELSDDQADAVRTLCRSGAGVQLVEGPAGSGKTSALRVARLAWEAEGYNVIGTALAARAAAQLQSGSGIRSSTLHRLLADLERPGGGLPQGSVVVVDEAGMVGSRMLARLMTQTAGAEAKLVLVGDHHQLPEVDAGGAFRGLLSRLGAARLTENHRQGRPDQSWERSALEQLRSGEVGAALSCYENAGRLVRFKAAEEAFGAVIAHWWEIHTREPDTTVAMMAVTNSEVAELNARARGLRRQTRELGEEITLPSTGVSFAVGDRVVAAENDARIDILNGTFGLVTGIDQEHRSLSVRTDAGALLTVPAWYLEAGHLSHGYATTIHKSQGASVDVGLFLASESAYREAGYVALSRGRVANHLYALAPENHRWEIGHG